MTQRTMEVENFRIRDEVVFRSEDDGGILYDLETGSMRIVNITGRVLLNVFENDYQISEMVELLVQRYPDKDPAAVEKDVRAFVDGIWFFTHEGYVEALQES